MHAPPFVEDQVMRDRLKETCEREFECGVERMVKRVFEARRGLPDELYEIPWIGGTYRPRAPRTSHADLMRNVCRALCAQKWFEHTAPSRPQPLSTPWHCDRRVGIAPRTRPSTNSWHTNCAASRSSRSSDSGSSWGAARPTSRTNFTPRPWLPRLGSDEIVGDKRAKSRAGTA